MGWQTQDERRLVFRPPGSVPATPAQRATGWFFFTVAALLLVQTLLGGATAHYHAETGGFFGIDLARFLPYNLTRTWHLQLALFFVVGAYLAAGIFLAPIIAGREPRGQRLLTLLLFGAVVVVVVGSLAGFASYDADGTVLALMTHPTAADDGWQIYLDNADDSAAHTGTVYAICLG